MKEELLEKRLEEAQACIDLLTDECNRLREEMEGHGIDEDIIYKLWPEEVVEVKEPKHWEAHRGRMPRRDDVMLEIDWQMDPVELGRGRYGGIRGVAVDKVILDDKVIPPVPAAPPPEYVERLGRGYSEREVIVDGQVVGLWARGRDGAWIIRDIKDGRNTLPHHFLPYHLEEAPPEHIERPDRKDKVREVIDDGQVVGREVRGSDGVWRICSVHTKDYAHPIK